MSERVSASIRIEAAPERVFEFFTRPDAMIEWMGEQAQLDPRPGGRFEVTIRGARVRGEYVEVEPPNRLLLTWGYEGSDVLPPGSSTVEVRLVPDASGTRVDLDHRDLPTNQATPHRVGWEHYFGRLELAGAGSPPGSDPGMPDPSSSTPTLYDWAGGGEAFRRLIDAFYDRVEADDLLSPFFPGGVSEQHRAHVTAWWCEVFGGPAGYTNELGGYEAMLAHHRGLGITPEQRFRFASLMSLAADDAGLPDDPEFRSAFIAYVEWGTRLALANSQPGAEVVEHAPVPRWGWGVAPPYQP